MKFLLNFFLAALMPVIIFSQGRVVFNGANMIITNNGKLVVDNPAPEAITVITSGGVISESADNGLIWNIGNNAANYMVPFISGSTAIPVFFTTSGGTGNGSFSLSTYAGADWQNSNYLPPTVTNINSDGVDNSNHVIDRFWQINASGYTTQPSLSNLIFTYKENEWNETGNSISEANLTAQNWNNTSNQWMSSLGIDNTSLNQVAIANVNETNYYPWWTLVSSDFPLPLTLLSFTLEKQNENALLEWLVTAQINVSFFEVQRSTDATHFVPVGKVEAINNTSTTISYSYTDTLSSMNPAVIYYRLRMVDRDGKFTYSPVRSISFANDNNKLIQISPNPATNVAIIRFGAIAEGAYQVSFLNAEGKRIITQNIHVTPNSVFYFYRSSNMSKGTYFVTVTGNNVNQAFTIIYQ